MTAMRNVLLVEDEKAILIANKTILERRGGYKVRLAESLAEARQCLEQSIPDIILLDIMLPDGNGLDLLCELRESNIKIPVLLLTALNEISDEIKGIEAGGNEYITKPYNNDVLLTRIDMLLKNAESMPDKIALGAIKIDVSARRVYVNDKEVALTSKELSLLEVFMQNPEKIFNGDYLYEKVWGQKMMDDDSVLRKTISKLRTKLQEFDAGYTVTVSRGEGWYFEQE